MYRIIGSLVLVALYLSSCSIIRKTKEHDLSDGTYTKKEGSQKSIVFVDVEGDDFRIFPVIRERNNWAADTSGTEAIYLPSVVTYQVMDFNLVKRSFDLDVLTTPLKIRFATAGIPSQLNATLNGSVFAGFRTDVYTVKYQQNPLKAAARHVTRLGYSIGLFSGIGNSLISPSTTQDRIAYEYDGITWSKGLAGFLGINNYTIGLTVGIDHLLDGNRQIWIYERKPWLGLSFGLNLN